MLVETPPCRICGKREPVCCYPADNPSQTICPDCCVNAEHADGETGHVFEYERSERESFCTKCGIPRRCTDYDYED